jgi:hypothetical protein
MHYEDTCSLLLSLNTNSVLQVLKPASHNSSIKIVSLTIRLPRDKSQTI